MNERIKKHLVSVAESTLAMFESVSATARARLSERPTASQDALAAVNTLTSGNAIVTFNRIIDDSRTSLRHLVHEPALARVAVLDENGNERIYFICRTSPVLLPESEPKLASYLSPLGRLAALPVGETVRLPRGGLLEVTEQSRLRPVNDNQGWDSTNTVFEGGTYGPLTVESLRALLPRELYEEHDENILEKLLVEEMAVANVVEGIRRTVLTRMELRDQPILDRFQDRIFRLPLNSHFLLLGPPGTGKTTTLIRRLGQKLDQEFLTADERLLIEDLGGARGIPHRASWIMFTPTVLLQQYIKESFSREGVPASDRHVRTWTDYRRELARNELGLLRTPTKRSAFVMQESVTYLSDSVESDLTGWFDDFQAWQRAAFVERLRDAAEELGSLGQGKLLALGEGLLTIINSEEPSDVAHLFHLIRSRADEARQLAVDLKSEIDTSIRRALVRQVNRNRNFLDDLAAFLDRLGESREQQLLDGDVREEDEDDEDDEDEGGLTSRTGRKGAEVAFGRAVRTEARAEASGKRLRKGTRTERILEWIGTRGLDAPERMKVGTSVLIRARVSSFVNPVKSYLDRIGARYRRYRRTRQSEGRWYLNGALRQTDIHPLELDMLVLAILSLAQELLRSREVRRDLHEPFWSALRAIDDSYRNQIFADEATDFSPIQLSCMSALSHPNVRSFFACGDFNQRLTTWGTRSTSEIAWVGAGIEIESVTIGYRQSRELNEFARQIVRIAGGAEHDIVLPTHADQGGVRPVLVENIASNEEVASWLARRVIEIESFVGQLPSIAVLVPEETQVVPLAEALGEALFEHNMNVVACPNGQVIGQDNDIRVFNARHIKGLEFEAVFFKDVDRLVVLYPELFDKFLYVGATRAATYLGLTCSGTLPAVVSDVRSMFVSKWDG